MTNFKNSFSKVNKNEIESFYNQEISFKKEEEWNEYDDNDFDGNDPNYNEEEDEDEDPDLRRYRGRALQVFGSDLTKAASLGQFEECIGREQELLEMMEILIRRQKNNPVLVGEAGVGKTAIIELFATKIVNNLVPFILEGRTLISLDLSRIISGTRYRGEFEQRLQYILDEALDQPNVMLFIDEIHTIVGAGASEGSLDMANILKPVLSRSGFQCIGATTTKEYEKIEKDPALNRRFQPIRIKEPTIQQTIQILYGLRPSLEGYHNVEITCGAIELAVELAERYIYDRFLPDKAIDLIDRAAAREVLRLTNVREGSVLSGMINASLVHLGKLKVEAFRRGDIATEFIFQEIENAYRNVLLRWIENPTEMTDQFDRDVKKVQSGEGVHENNVISSPLANSFYDMMQMSILYHIDEILFSSANPRFETKQSTKFFDLSINRNEILYFKLHSYGLKQYNSYLLQNKHFPMSVYRFSLYLFKQWQKQNLSEHSLIDSSFLSQLSSRFERFDGFTYFEDLVDIIDENVVVFSREDDFIDGDLERKQSQYSILSQLEQTKIEIFSTYLDSLQPLLTRGVIGSLERSSKLNLTDEERQLVYNLLGYASTEGGKLFLSRKDDPELIKRARKLGDFTGLKTRITQTHIEELLAQMTGIPIQSVSNEEEQKLNNLEVTFHKRVIGQEEAVTAISRAIRRSRLGLQNPNRPIASFLFCGPTGVGKTEVTKALAVTMFGSEADMIRLDMSEFMEKYTISRLIGSPPGYVGYEDGGQLTDAVRRRPYSVVLFDEVEKAHPDIMNILLQVLEDGRLTDSQKRLIPFDNTIIIMTSNAGSEDIQELLKFEDTTIEQKQKTEKLVKKKQKEEKKTNKEILYDNEVLKVLHREKKEKQEEESIEYQEAIEFLKSPIQNNYLEDIKEQLRIEFEKSFRQVKDYTFIEREIRRANGESDEKVTDAQTTKTLKDLVLQKLSGLFLPEFLNRLDDIIIFKPLRPEELKKICNIMISQIQERVKPKKIELIVDDDVKNKLSREGYNPSFGARPLRRLITKNIEDLISENLLKNITKKSEKIRTLRITLNDNDEIHLIETNEKRI